EVELRRGRSELLLQLRSDEQLFLEGLRSARRHGLQRAAIRQREVVARTQAELIVVRFRRRRNGRGDEMMLKRREPAVGDGPLERAVFFVLDVELVVTIAVGVCRPAI